MPRIDMVKEATAIGVGAVDELAEFVDRNRGWTQPFRNATDYVRIGLAVVGGYLWSQNQATDYSDVLLTSGSTLAVKSVSRVLREGFAGTPTTPTPGRRAVPNRINPIADLAGRRAAPTPMALPAGRSGAVAMSAIERAQAAPDHTLLITRV